MIAAFAFPKMPGLVRVERETPAFLTCRLAVGIGPTDAPESVPRFLIRHSRDGRQRERPSGRGKEEVLSHNVPVCENIIANVISLSILKYQI